jgi:hypothetical protein
MAKKLGEMLIESNLITPSQLESALDRQRSWGGRLGTNLIMTGALDEQSLLRFLAKKTGIAEVDLSKIDITQDLLKLIPQKIAEQYNVVPISHKDKQTVIAAFADPTDLAAVDEVRFVAGREVFPVIATLSQIRDAINRFYLGVRLSEQEQRTRFAGANIGEMGGGHAVPGDPDLIIYSDQKAPKGSSSKDGFALDFKDGDETSPAFAHLEVQALLNILSKRGLVSIKEFEEELHRLK